MQSVIQALKTAIAQNQWVNLDNLELISDAELRERIAQGIVTPDTVSNSPEEFPVFGNMTLSLIHI